MGGLIAPSRIAAKPMIATIPLAISTAGTGPRRIMSILPLSLLPSPPSRFTFHDSRFTFPAPLPPFPHFPPRYFVTLFLFSLCG